MIDEERTLEIYGYESSELTSGSGKLIVAVCEGCGRYKDLRMCDYSDLCQKCATSKANTGRKLSENQKEVVSKAQTGRKKSKGEVEKLKNWWTPERCEDRRLENLGEKNPFSDCNHSDKSKMIQSTAKTGENNPNFGYEMPEDQKIKISCGVQGIPVEDFDGFIGNGQLHLKSISQCIQINKRTKGWDAHHITSGAVIFIPEELHEFIYHNLKTGYNMKEMNTLAIQFMMGEIYEKGVQI